MPSRTISESDSPKLLRRLSDLHKGNAIASAISGIAATPVRVSVQYLNYDGLRRNGAFRNPAEIRFDISVEDPKLQDALLGTLKRITDEELADSCASSLGDATGEVYVGRLLSKRYVSKDGLSRARVGSGVLATIHLQVARRTSA